LLAAVEYVPSLHCPVDPEGALAGACAINACEAINPAATTIHRIVVFIFASKKQICEPVELPHVNAQSYTGATKYVTHPDHNRSLVSMLIPPAYASRISISR
jgi:hypothetical protein